MLLAKKKKIIGDGRKTIPFHMRDLETDES